MVLGTCELIATGKTVRQLLVSAKCHYFDQSGVEVMTLSVIGGDVTRAITALYDQLKQVPQEINGRS